MAWGKRSPHEATCRSIASRSNRERRRMSSINDIPSAKPSGCSNAGLIVSAAEQPTDTAGRCSQYEKLGSRSLQREPPRRSRSRSGEPNGVGIRPRSAKKSETIAPTGRTRKMKTHIALIAAAALGLLVGPAFAQEIKDPAAMAKAGKTRFCRTRLSRSMTRVSMRS